MVQDKNDDDGDDDGVMSRQWVRCLFLLVYVFVCLAVLLENHYRSSNETFRIAR